MRPETGGQSIPLSVYNMRVAVYEIAPTLQMGKKRFDFFMHPYIFLIAREDDISGAFAETIGEIAQDTLMGVIGDNLIGYTACFKNTPCDFNGAVLRIIVGENDFVRFYALCNNAVQLFGDKLFAVMRTDAYRNLHKMSFPLQA